MQSVPSVRESKKPHSGPTPNQRRISMHVSSTSLLDCVISEAIYASKSPPSAAKVAHSYSPPYGGHHNGGYCQPSDHHSIYHSNPSKPIFERVFQERRDSDDFDEESSSSINHCSADADSTHSVPIKSMQPVMQLWPFLAINFSNGCSY